MVNSNRGRNTCEIFSHAKLENCHFRPLCDCRPLAEERTTTSTY